VRPIRANPPSVGAEPVRQPIRATFRRAHGHHQRVEISDGRGRRPSAADARKTERAELITLHDAAVVSWPADKRKPKIQQMNDLVGSGDFGGSFWGLPFGLIFVMPLLGMAVGTTAWNFLMRVYRPGPSALDDSA
jgi:hypothetical protein